jgi:DNA topoisomerase-2
MYIGTDVCKITGEYIYDIGKNIVLKKAVPGAVIIKSLFNPVLDNACESNITLLTQNIIPKAIEVTVDENVINIKNYGVNIPIISQDNGRDKCYIPEMIFGTMSANFNYGNSRNHGVKITNIFSKLFEITVCNTLEMIEYKQSWYDNAKIQCDPVLESYDEKEPSVQVKYIMDFERFNLPPLYTQDTIWLLAHAVATKSYYYKIPIIFNDRLIDISNIHKYAELYVGDSLPSNFIFKQDDLEFCLIDTPNKGQIVSHVNGVLTEDDGVHVDAILNRVMTPFDIDIELINKIRYFKKHLTVIVNFSASNPSFTSQSKSKLIFPIPQINLDTTSLIDHIRRKTVPSIIKSTSLAMMLLCAKLDPHFSNEFSIIPHDIVNCIVRVLILGEWNEQLQIMQLQD